MEGDHPRRSERVWEDHHEILGRHDLDIGLCLKLFLQDFNPLDMEPFLRKKYEFG